MPFPLQRLRRLRRSPILRRLVRETRLDVDDLIYPMFVVHGRAVSRPIPSMPGICQLSVDRAVAEAREVRDLGIPGVILFGIPDKKDAVGSEAYDPSGVIPQASLSLESSLAGYEVGNVDFLTLTNTLLSLLNFEMQYYEELAKHEQALARLEPLVGMQLTQP